MTNRTPLACLAVPVLLALTARGAPAVHSPFTQRLSAYALERNGVELVGVTRRLVEFAPITAVPDAFAAFCYTAPSAVGAGLQLLARGVVPR